METVLRLCRESMAGYSRACVTAKTVYRHHGFVVPPKNISHAAEMRDKQSLPKEAVALVD